MRPINPRPITTIVSPKAGLRRRTPCNPTAPITVKAAASSKRLKNVLEYSTLPVVSSDIIGNPHSSIYDAPFTRVVEGRFVKTLNWYDNEWGYSNRVVDLIDLLRNLD